MHTQAMSWLVTWTIMLAAGLMLTLVLVGCERGGGPSTPPSLVTGTGGTDPDQPGRGTLAEQTRAMADRLAAGVDGDSAGQNDDAWDAAQIDAGFDPFADAAPLPTRRPPEPPGAAVGTGAQAEARPALAELEKRGIEAFEGAGSARVPGPSATFEELVDVPPAPAPLTRSDILEELVQQLRRGDDPAMAKAVTAAALSLADPQQRLDPRLLESLKPLQRESVQRLQQLLVSLREQAAQGGGSEQAAMGRAFDRKMLDSALNDAFDAMPITIVHAGLCRSVSGYGVYEPMGGSSFLSGQANRAIVYVEVEDFATSALDDGQREVRLMQELILYKENDGLAVWRHQPTQIVDVSRNRRRDFYVVQMITLPARLSEGRYRLKVRLTDQHGGAVDETTLRIQVVADAGLLDGNPAD